MPRTLKAKVCDFGFSGKSIQFSEMFHSNDVALKPRPESDDYVNRPGLYCFKIFPEPKRGRGWGLIHSQYIESIT